jgi:uncharacterized membrane protein YdjX (TVP38/TMEM64 family)
MAPDTLSRQAKMKAAFLFLFLTTAVILVHWSPLKDYLTVATLGTFLKQSGFLAPAVFIVLFVVGACLFVPGSLLASLGAALFGTGWGFLYAWLGAILGAALSFLIGRHLGREFAASLIGDRLRHYDDRIAQHGFATVLYLRLMYFPYCPMNFGMGLTRVSFWDFLWGSAAGLTVSLFIITFFAGTIRDVWLSGQWHELFGWKIFLGVGLFILSLFIPRVVGRFSGHRTL